MPPSVEEFLRRLERSHILDEDASAAAKRLAKRQRDAQFLAHQFVQHDLLTRFQAKALLREQSPTLTLGNYVLLERLGRGGMGHVFKARHRRLKRVVALKTLPPEVTSSSEHLEWFRREVEAAGKLEHPNIVHAYDADEAAGAHFLVMQYVDGIDLGRLVQKLGPLPVADAIEAAHQAAQGLACAHERGVVHRDIKPTNLIVGRDGVVRILDMGLASIISDGRPKAARAMGTADFLAPEQARLGAQPDPRADIYSLGCALFFLLTGKAPFTRATAHETLAAHRDDDLPPLGIDAPAELEAVCRRMLAKDPQDRYSSAESLLAALEPLRNEREARLKERCSQALAMGRDSDSLGPLEKPAHPGLVGDEDEDERESSLDEGDARTAPLGSRPAAPNAPNAPSTRRSQIVGMAVALTMLLILGASLTLLPDRSPSRGNEQEAADPERRAAEWVLLVGGAVQVDSEGFWRTINARSQLPPGPFRVATVQLGGNRRVTNEGLKHLADLKELRMLWLGGASIDDQGLESLKGLASLHLLSLADTRITDEGLRWLAGMRELHTLRLARTGVSDAGLRRLAPLESLQTLDLRGTAVSDAGVDALRELPLLRHLLIEGTQVSESGAAELERALPRLTVHRTGASGR